MQQLCLDNWFIPNKIRPNISTGIHFNNKKDNQKLKIIIKTQQLINTAGKIIIKTQQLINTAGKIAHIVIISFYISGKGT